MNIPKPGVPAEIDALSDDLRASDDSPRPIPSPDQSPRTRIGGQR